MGFLIAVNDDDAIPGRAVPQTQFGWFGAAHNELSYGKLTLAGPPTVIEPLRIVEIKPDLATGNITLRWEGGEASILQPTPTPSTSPRPAAPNRRRVPISPSAQTRAPWRI